MKLSAVYSESTLNPGSTRLFKDLGCSCRENPLTYYAIVLTKTDEGYKLDYTEMRDAGDKYPEDVVMVITMPSALDKSWYHGSVVDYLRNPNTELMAYAVNGGFDEFVKNYVNNDECKILRELFIEAGISVVTFTDEF